MRRATSFRWKSPPSRWRCGRTRCGSPRSSPTCSTTRPSTPSAGGQIWLAVRRENGGVVISVRDTGIGIPRDMLPRVFELFTQVDRHVDRAQGGLGIGLTLVKSLVEMHGGTVEAHSEGPGAEASSSCGCHLPSVTGRARRPGRSDRTADAACLAAGPGRRRQPRRSREPRDAAEAARCRRARRIRRRSRPAGSRGLPAHGGAARHRHAGHGRARGGAADSSAGASSTT